jgi:aspartate kinase
VFKALADIPVHMISLGASSCNLTLLVDEQHIPSALNRLHGEFFESVALSDVFEPIAG